MEGPPPSDPSVLDGVAEETADDAPVRTSVQPPPSPSRPTGVVAAQAVAPVQSSAAASLSYGQQQARQLLSPGMSGRPSAAQTTTAPTVAPTTPAPQPAPPSNDLFSLDFHAPPSTSSTSANVVPRKDVKQDILSLFSSPATASAPQPSAFGSFGNAAPVSTQSGSGWDAFGTASAVQPAAQQSMMGSSGAGMWGTSSGWSQPAAPAPASAGIWGAAAGPAPSLLNSNNVWGSSGAAPTNATVSDILPFQLLETY
jgi:stromal membrane-associated protein